MIRNWRNSLGWIWLMVAVITLGALRVIASNRSPSPEPLSTSSAKPNGALALYLWLQRAGYQVVAGAPADLADGAPTHQTIMVLKPSADLWSSRELATLQWVREGGRLILGIDGFVTPELLRAVDMAVLPAPPDAIHVSQPLLLAPPVATLSGSTATILSGTIGAEVASTSYGAVLARRPFGRGEIWLLSAPNLLDNAHLGGADNRRLALNLVGSPDFRVSFDEGKPQPVQSAGGQGDWLSGTVWGVALVFVLLVLLLYRWLSGWRLGPPEVAASARYRPAVEYVVSLAGLLRRARKRGEVLKIYQQALRRSLAARHGVSHPERAEIDAEIERLLNSRPQLSEAELIQEVEEIVELMERMRARRD